MTDLPNSIDQLVFSGGGLRCFWQGGVMSVLDRERGYAPARVTGVSGGALAAAGWISSRGEQLLDTMCAAFEEQDSNIDLFHRGEDGLTPHQTLYCDVVEKVMESAAAEIVQGPAFQIAIAHPPDNYLPPGLTGSALAAAYEAELHMIGSPHFSWAEKLGLEAHLEDANDAAREGKLVELICAAAVIPPVFEPPLWKGKRVVDSGMADQAPMPEPDEGETLILLTREYDRIPEHPNRHYLSPSHEVEADKIDFTDPEKLRRTWQQGVEDAERFLDG